MRSRCHPMPVIHYHVATFFGFGNVSGDFAILMHLPFRLRADRARSGFLILLPGCGLLLSSSIAIRVFDGPPFGYKPLFTWRSVGLNPSPLFDIYYSRCLYVGLQLFGLPLGCCFSDIALWLPGLFVLTSASAALKNGYKQKRGENDIRFPLFLFVPGSYFQNAVFRAVPRCCMTASDIGTGRHQLLRAFIFSASFLRACKSNHPPVQALLLPLLIRASLEKNRFLFSQTWTISSWTYPKEVHRAPFIS